MPEILAVVFGIGQPFEMRLAEGLEGAMKLPPSCSLGGLGAPSRRLGLRHLIDWTGTDDYRGAGRRNTT